MADLTAVAQWHKSAARASLPDTPDGAAERMGRLYRQRYPSGPGDRHALRGWTAYADGAFTEAEAAFADALQAQPAHPLAVFGLGMLSWSRGDYAQATDWLRVVAAAGWAGAAADWALGSVLADSGEDMAAEPSLRRAVTSAPTASVARFKLAQLALRRGDFAEGWPLYEARRDLNNYLHGVGAAYRELPPDAEWRGERLGADQALVLLAENGIGDKLLFSRFLPHVMARVRSDVGAVTAPSLIRLWKHNFPDLLEVTAVGQQTEYAYDRWAFPESLPLVFGVTLSTLPPAIPLRPRPADVQHWRKRLELRHGTLNVGLAWAASAPRRARPIDPLDGKTPPRSVPLERLAPLAGIPGIRWLGLQKGPNEHDQAPPGLAIERIGPCFRDFADTAAVVELLDLVICVDTSVSNLAGALGKPFWVLLPRGADWRWSTGDRSAWFPEARMFRQEHEGDWSAPVAEMAEALARLVAERMAA